MYELAKQVLPLVPAPAMGHSGACRTLPRPAPAKADERAAPVRPIATQGQTEYWADRCPERGPESRPINSVCVTLYNEPRSLFERTIVSIVATLEHFHRHESGRAGRSVLCVMADGSDELDPGVREFLCEHGLIWRSSAPRAETVRFFRSWHDCRRLRERLEGRSSGSYRARRARELE